MDIPIGLSTLQIGDLVRNIHFEVEHVGMVMEKPFLFYNFCASSTVVKVLWSRTVPNGGGKKLSLHPIHVLERI